MIETRLDPARAMAACLVQWRHAIIDCDDAGLQDQVRDIESASRMLHSVMLETVAELESRNIATTAGFRNTKQLLAGMLNLSSTEAGTRVAHAVQLAARRTLTGEALAPLLPNTAAALAAGEIGPAQVRVITEPIDRSYTTVMDSGQRHRRGGTSQGGRAGVGGGVSGWVGQPAAVYCRVSSARDEDQTGVDRQERLCRAVADRLGLVIAAGCVFVDNNRSAWQRRRRRPGWDALLTAIRAGGVGHVIVYHPDRLMRQPRDLEELLTLSDEHDITLHGQANRRDLSDPDDRFFLRIEVAHACRSSDDTSRRLRDALEDRARDGRPHTSARRPYGYAPDARTVIEAEALVVREMFARYLDGATPREIAEALNARGQPAAGGGLWHPASVRRMLRSRHVTGIRVFRGQEFGEGDWPAIIDRGTWAEVQDRSAYRASAHAYRSSRFYVLRGLVVCKRCGTHMSGSRGRAPSYMCTRRNELGPTRCTRRIHATMLEAFVTDAAVELLTHLDVTGAPSAATALSARDEATIAADEHELAELKDMWTQRELSTREYRQMRKTVEDRITTLQRKTIVRPTVEVLAGLVGPHARASWDELVAQGQWQRLNAVLRFLFAAVIIDEHRGKTGTFDYSRIDIEPNPL